eukprot:9503851-Pyramimonas_sp.AAC.14
MTELARCVAGAGAPRIGRRELPRGEVSVKWSEPREPRNPSKSEEYRRHLQGVLYGTRGAQTSKTRGLPTLRTPRIPRSELRVHRTGSLD